MRRLPFVLRLLPVRPGVNKGNVQLEEIVNLGRPYIRSQLRRYRQCSPYMVGIRALASLVYSYTRHPVPASRRPPGYVRHRNGSALCSRGASPIWTFSSGFSIPGALSSTLPDVQPVTAAAAVRYSGVCLVSRSLQWMQCLTTSILPAEPILWIFPSSWATPHRIT